MRFLEESTGAHGALVILLGQNQLTKIRGLAALNCGRFSDSEIQQGEPSFKIMKKVCSEKLFCSNYLGTMRYQPL